jgi:FkbM family methyltransferase
MIFATTITRLIKFAKVFSSIKFLRALFFHRVLAGVEHRRVLVENLAPVVDIGANRGQFAIAVRRYARKARVIAFEPLAVAADRFKRLFKGDSKVILYQVAIGPVAGKTTLHVAAADDSSSLLTITALQNRLFPGTYEISTEMVNIGPLNEFVVTDEIVSPAMLKLDVQGFELKALQGCEMLLERFSYVYVECSFVELYHGQALVDDIVAWLSMRGWHLGGIYNLVYDKKGQSIQADFLFKLSR